MNKHNQIASRSPQTNNTNNYNNNSGWDLSKDNSSILVENEINKVNIEFLRGQMDKVLVDIEKLKDQNREMKYTNGNSQ